MGLASRDIHQEFAGKYGPSYWVTVCSFVEQVGPEASIEFAHEHEMLLLSSGSLRGLHPLPHGPSGLPPLARTVQSYFIPPS